MLKVDQKTIAEILEVSQQSIIRWEKDKGFPVIRDEKRSPYYDVKECFKWYYKDDWKYFYSKIVEWGEEEDEL